jgi:hypothetical protein
MPVSSGFCGAFAQRTRRARLGPRSFSFVWRRGRRPVRSPLSGWRCGHERGCGLCRSAASRRAVGRNSESPTHAGRARTAGGGGRMNQVKGHGRLMTGKLMYCGGGGGRPLEVKGCWQAKPDPCSPQLPTRAAGLKKQSGPGKAKHSLGRGTSCFPIVEPEKTTPCAACPRMTYLKKQSQLFGAVLPTVQTNRA